MHHAASLLIVNDEAKFIVLIERILSCEGCQVTAVHGSDQALLDREPFDLSDEWR